MRSRQGEMTEAQRQNLSNDTEIALTELAQLLDQYKKLFGAMNPYDHRNHFKDRDAFLTEHGLQESCKAVQRDFGEAFITCFADAVVVPRLIQLFQSTSKEKRKDLHQRVNTLCEPVPNLRIAIRDAIELRFYGEL